MRPARIRPCPFLSHPPSPRLPPPFDPARATRTFEALAEHGFAPNDTDRPVLTAIFGNSPFLARLAIREHALLAPLLDAGPDAIVAAARTLALSAATPKRRPRRWRACASPSAAPRSPSPLADIAGIWPLEDVTRALTAVRRCLRQGRPALRAARGGAEGGDARARRRRAGSRDRPRRPGHGQIRRLRAQLFQRHRPRRVLRSAPLSRSTSATIRAAPPSIWCAASSSC